MAQFSHPRLPALRAQLSVPALRFFFSAARVQRLMRVLRYALPSAPPLLVFFFSPSSHTSAQRLMRVLRCQCAAPPMSYVIKCVWQASQGAVCIQHECFAHRGRASAPLHDAVLVPYSMDSMA